jgi:hypothetical protein
VSLYERIFAEDLGLDEPGARERGRQVEAVVRSHTNHFLTPIATQDTMLEGRASQSTRLRYKQLCRALDGGVGSDVAAITDLLSSESSNDESIFQRKDDSRPWLEQCATLATFGFEVPRRPCGFEGRPIRRFRWSASSCHESPRARRFPVHRASDRGRAAAPAV